MAELAEHFLRLVVEKLGFHRRYVSTRVGRLHILESDAAGAGRLPTTVLLHGLGSTGVHYLPMLPGLRGQVRRLILPDLPAHGFSDMPRINVTSEVLLEGVTETLNEVLDEPAVIFGNSLGGAIAIRYALNCPELVRGLVLCSPAGAPESEADFQHLVSQFKMDTRAEALDFVDRLFAHRHPFRQLLAEGVRRRFRKMPLYTLVGALTPEDAFTPEMLQELQVPVRLLWGCGDRILPRAHFDFFRRNLPHAEVQYLDDVGHSPYLERPRIVVEQVLDFLRKVDLPQQPARPAPHLRVVASA